jgi:hypothetical protein
MKKYSRFIGLSFFAIFLFSFAVSAGHISEVMYNPPGNDNTREYVEVILNKPMSMQNWTVKDGSNLKDVLVLVEGRGNSKINLIVENDYNLTNFNTLSADLSIYSAGSMIGNGLGNSGDLIKLYDVNNTLVDSVSYDGSIANGNGMAVCYFDSTMSYECEATPGKRNKGFRFKRLG